MILHRNAIFVLVFITRRTPLAVPPRIGCSFLDYGGCDPRSVTTHMLPPEALLGGLRADDGRLSMIRRWSRLMTMQWWYAIPISGWVISLILIPVLAHRYSPTKALGWLAVMFAVP